jgi:oligosaccharide translocation protein RFT1
MLALGASLFVQSIVKHVLTQGDVIVISYLATLHAQGIYALVSNYGGLIARLLLQPIEESSRNYFSKALSTLDKRPSAAAIESTHDNIHNLLRFYVLLSTVAVAVGPYTAPVLLRIVAGSRWANTGAADVLSKYCYYIPLLAINGITEAFVSSVATQSELNAQSAWMMAFSLAFAAASYLFLRVLDWGAEGLVWANGINMSMRIIWSVTFIHAFFRRHGKTFGLDEVLPRGSTITLAVGVIAVFNRVQLATGNELADTAKCALVAGTFLILV